MLLDFDSGELMDVQTDLLRGYTMNVRISASISALVFGLALVSGPALAGTTDADAWAQEAFADPCMNGDVPANGIVKATIDGTPDA